MFTGKSYLKGKEKQIEQEFELDDESFKTQKLSSLGFELTGAPDGVTLYGPAHLMPLVKEKL